MSKPNVLVTGGAGYIGSHACRALATAGYTPIVFDDFSTGWRDSVQFGPVIEGTVCDGDSLDRAFRDFRLDAVMHFAARSLVSESVTDPHSYWQHNVDGTLTLLEVMRRNHVDSIVFSSTAAVYGEPSEKLIRETTLLNPVNPYGATKRAIEDMIHNYATAYGLRAVVFRYFNVAGAAVDGMIGEQHQPETHLIPLVLQAAMGQCPPVKIFGTDYPTPDGTCIRDYVHVMDVVEAHVLGLQHILSGCADGPVLVCNLGNGIGYSVRQIIARASDILGHSVPFECTSRRTGDPAHLVCDPSLARRRLGWAAQRGLDDMIESAAEWHRGSGYVR